MINSSPIKSLNLEMLTFAAEKMGDLRSEVVFLGGCTTALLLTEQVAPDVRQTVDVDCIIDVITLSEYYRICRRLQEKGFNQSIDDDVLCRWRFGNLILDVMPTDEKILGFCNKWYKDASKHAMEYQLSEEISIFVITAPYFLACKIEAFLDRGNQDYFSSRDFEDIIAVIDGRPSVLDELIQSDYSLKAYISKSFKDMLSKTSFQDALPGHLNYGQELDARVNIIRNRIIKITEIIR